MLVGHVDEVADDLGHVGDRRQLVGVERLRQHRAGARVVEPVLRERVPERLDDPALDLAAGAERVDHAADVVDRDHLLDPHLAGADVDGDLGELDPEREHAHAGRIRAAGALAEDLAVVEQAGDLIERPAAAVGGNYPPALQRQQPLLSIVALRCQLDHLARGVGCGRAHGRAHRGQRRRAAGDRRERAAGRVADLHLDVVERQAELLRRDHRHRRAGARADVLHRRDDVRAAVGAEAHPGVAGRAAAAVPDLARHPHAALPDLVRARAHLLSPRPVRLRAAIALHQALRREGSAVHRVGMRVVELPQLERVDPELRRELVEQALERPRPLDEAGRAEGGHRRDVQLRAVLDRLHVLAGVEQLRRPGGRRQPAFPAERARVLAPERGQRPVRPRRGGHPLARRVAVAADDVLLAARERAAHRPPRPFRQLGCEHEVVADSVLGAEAAAHELADHPHLVLRQAEALGQVAAEPPDVLSRDVDVEAVAAPLADALVRLERVVVQRLGRVLGLDDGLRLGEAPLVVATLVAARLLDQRAALDRLVGVEQRLELLPLDLDQLDRGPRLSERLGRDAGNGARLRNAPPRRCPRPRPGRRPPARRERLPPRRGRSAAPAPARAGCARSRSRASRRA